MWTGGKLATVPAAGVLYAINAKGLAVGSTSIRQYTIYNSAKGKVRVYNAAHVKSMALSAINASGLMCGYASTRDQQSIVAIANGKTLTLLQPFGSYYSVATAINDSGEIVGYHRDNQGASHGFTYSGGSFLVGSAYATGFILENGSYTNFAAPAATEETIVDGIGPRGEVIGVFVENANSHGFIYKNSTHYQIDYPGQQSTDVKGVNALGSLFGTYYVNNNYVNFIAQCAPGAFCTK